jgi:hypothetical protein
MGGCGNELNLIVPLLCVAPAGKLGGRVSVDHPNLPAAPRAPVPFWFRRVRLRLYQRRLMQLQELSASYMRKETCVIETNTPTFRLPGFPLHR